MTFKVFIKISGLILLWISIFSLSYQYNQRFLDWLRFQSLGTRDYIVERLGMMFIEIPPEKALLYLLLFSFGPGALIFLAFLPHFFPGVPFALITTAILSQL